MEFRAGKMFSEGKRVVPDTRKGLVRITRGEQGLVHFQWLDRVQNIVEDDQIVFPDEAVFEKVNQSSERVYILKFNTDDRKFFFWLQEPKSDDDEELCESVNYYINQPLEDTDASIPVQLTEDVVEDDTSSRDGNLVSPNMGTEISSGGASSSGAVKLADLQRILSNLGSAVGTEDPDVGGLELADILKPDLIIPLIETLQLDQCLVSYLPEGEWGREDLIDLLQSPPFRQQVDSFTYVLRTGQIDLSQFGINPSKYKFTVLSFLEALEDSVSGTLESESESVQSKACDLRDPMDESK